MPSVHAQLKDLRQKVEALQVEVSGRQHISSMVVWEEQNRSYVNQEGTTSDDDFSGLIVHLTQEVSTPEETVEGKDGMSQNDFKILKEEIVRQLAQSTSRDVDGAG